MRVLALLAAVLLATTSCSGDAGRAVPGNGTRGATQQATPPAGDGALVAFLVGTTGCGAPVEQREYAGRSGVTMYTCGATRGVIHLTADREELDALVAEAPCQPDQVRVRGDRWLFTALDASLAPPLLADGGERVPCG